MRKFLPLIFLALVSCTGSESGGSDTPEPAETAVADPASLEFSFEAGTKTFVVTSDEKPSKVTSSAYWCSVCAGEYSSGKTTVEVSVEQNPDADSRSTTIYVKTGKTYLEVPVTQDCEKIELQVSDSSFDCECYGLYDAVLTVTSTRTPEVTSDVAWCNVESVSAGKDRTSTVKFHVGASRLRTPRVGNLTVKCGSASVSVRINQKAFSAVTASAEALTQQMVFDALGMGWGMGNHMDGYVNDVASETAWNKAICTQATMDGARAAGFTSVRIPVTWMGHIGEAGAYKVDDKWMDRVAEIVGYAHNAGLNVIINTHHDENNNESAAHWLDIKSAVKDNAVNEAIKDEIACLWSQIALKFKDCGEWLIFEPFNEIQDGGWGWSSSFRSNPKPQYKVLNEWNQVFVDAVRSTGGQNATRWLATVGYAQSSSTISINGLEIPQDYTSGNRIVVAFHDYDPYNYTLSNPLVEQWGHTADPSKRCSDNDEQNIIDTFELFKTTYPDKGIPVYIGEMGCSMHSAEDFAFQKYYIEYFCKAAADRQFPMIVWDNANPGTGSECHAYLDHGTGDFASEDARTLVELMTKAVYNHDPDYTLQTVWDSAPAQ